jgi:hypothetical protein
MLRLLFGLLIILHGLVHMWFVALSQRWVEFEPSMGWTSESWLFTPLIGDAATRALVSGLCVLATLSFVVGGIGLYAHQAWWRAVVVASAILSTAIVLLFWDGKLAMLVEKGLIALAINAGLLIVILLLDWPAV